jgi:hypothetical protein
MVLRVKLADERYDYVNSLSIDELIEQRRILMFYRPSEGKWVDVNTGLIRKKAGVFYIGPERRNPPPSDLFQ